jgi:hyperosmotically inducible periplasmic protein
MTKKWTVSLGAVALATGLAFAAPVRAADSPDAWITTKVKVSLLTAADVDGLDINVDTVAGKVTLHGQAATAAEKAQAEKIARQINGVKEVRNLIQIVPASKEEQVSTSDEKIREQIAAEFKPEPELSGVTIQSVNKGVVLLAGKVDTLSAHLRALELARGVPGVNRVESEIKSPDRLADNEIWHEPDVASSGAMGVRSAASDLWITSDAKVRLLASDVSGMEVNVDTRDGAVTLFGAVGTEAEKRTAADEVRKVNGVKSVRNELQVVPAARREATDRRDDQIQKDVEQQMASRVAGADIDVEVADGVVRLTGTVPSQGDRLAALTAARSSEGVRSVVGDLRVERN